MANIESVGDRCCGCGACMNICPKGAITMQRNAEGFLYPIIDKDKCINCGLCVRSCPLSNTAFKPDTNLPKCYAVQSTGDIMKHSSSGGVFSVLANYVFDNGGYVCGAAFDKKWLVEHKIISDKTNLYELQTSKYVQSDTKKVYTKIKELLNDDKMVLFSGTPCQVAGLYSFLGHDYDKLITVDVFCHGAPSPMVWERYLKEVAADKITDINFRDKPKDNFGNYNYNFKLETEKETYSTLHRDNIYMLGFLRNLYLRKSCHHCPFAKTPRTSDFSLGDFWGYETIDKTIDTNNGTSAVMLNTEKATKIFNQIRSNFSYVKSVSLSDISRYNDVLFQSGHEHQNRDAFFADCKKQGKIIPLIQKHLIKRDVAILNFSSFSKPNFGAGLVGYAMERAVEKLGYIPHTINFISEDELYKYTQQDNFSHFQNKFLHLTGICRNKSELRNFINQEFDKFVIGSDQVVRHPWHYNFIYYLDWVYGKKSLVSYAASFGVSKLGMNNKDKKYAQICLKRFDAFSVREHSGADIMKNNFNISDTPVVCDPTMLLDAEDYQPIIDAEKIILPNQEYIAFYFLDENPNVLFNLAKKYQIVNAHKDDQGNYRTFGQWLGIIKNAKYVVTDSFHGSVFSIIYQKQFVTLTTKTRGNERLESLMKILGENRLITEHDNLTESNLFEKTIDYKKAEHGITNAKQHGMDFLKHALQIDPNKKSDLLSEKKNVRFWLFGMLPIIRTTKKPNKTIICICGAPFIRIRSNNGFYLFNIIKIGVLK